MPSMPVEGGFTRSRRSAPPRSSTTRRHEELTEGARGIAQAPIDPAPQGTVFVVR